MVRNTINLAHPRSGKWEGRGFGRHFVWTYECPVGHTVRVRCNSWRGIKRTANGITGVNPVPGVGAIKCSQCEAIQASLAKDRDWQERVG